MPFGDNGKALGAVAIVLDVAPLLRQVHIQQMPAALDLALRDRTGRTFYGREGVFAEGPVRQRIALQDGLAFAGLLAFVVYLIGQRVAARRQHARDLARSEAEVWRKALRVIGHEIGNSLAPVTWLLHSARLMTSQPVPAWGYQVNAVTSLPMTVLPVGDTAESPGSVAAKLPAKVCVG
jgi:hypothetical protein